MTQFELLTAAALWEMARRGVDVGVVEAGLGGRYDATSVVAPGCHRAHQRRRSSTRAGSGRRSPTSPRRSSRSSSRARRSCSAQGLAPDGAGGGRARRGRARSRDRAPRGRCRPDCELRAPRHLPAAQPRARARRRGGAPAPAGRELDERRRARRGRRRLAIPGRLQALAERAADGARRRAQPRRRRGARRVAAARSSTAPPALVLGVLEDKDAAGMLRALLPALPAGVVHRAARAARALRPPRCSRRRASSASRTPCASRGPSARWRRRAGGPPSTARACSRRARSISSASCSACPRER